MIGAWEGLVNAWGGLFQAWERPFEECRLPPVDGGAPLSSEDALQLVATLLSSSI